MQTTKILAEPLVDAATLSQALGLAIPTIYSLRSRMPDRLPPAVRVGGKLRWRPQDVRDWLDAQVEQETASPARRSPATPQVKLPKRKGGKGRPGTPARKGKGGAK